ncbi:hypothetical protein ACU4GD_37460 [Cupriavidus basilensis]
MTRPDSQPRRIAIVGGGMPHPDRHPAAAVTAARRSPSTCSSRVPSRGAGWPTARKTPPTTSTGPR